MTPEGVAEVVSEETDVPVERLLESDGERMLRLVELGFGERVLLLPVALRPGDDRGRSVDQCLEDVRVVFGESHQATSPGRD